MGHQVFRRTYVSSRLFFAAFFGGLRKVIYMIEKFSGETMTRAQAMKFSILSNLVVFSGLVAVSAGSETEYRIMLGSSETSSVEAVVSQVPA